VGPGPTKSAKAGVDVVGVSFVDQIKGGHDGEVDDERFFLCSNGRCCSVDRRSSFSIEPSLSLIFPFVLFCFSFLSFPFSGLGVLPGRERMGRH
jgi:hypothetical protein